MFIIEALLKKLFGFTQFAIGCIFQFIEIFELFVGRDGLEVLIEGVKTFLFNHQLQEIDINFRCLR